MRDVILSIDQGTTGSTALFLDATANCNVQVLSTHNVEFPNHYPQPGFVEHDVADIWTSVEQAILLAQEKLQTTIGDFKIVGIGITNQRETSLFWDKNTGEPIHRALVWQDRRTTDRCQELKEAGYETSVKQKTGLVLDPYFSGTKAEWLLKNVPLAHQKAQNGEILFGTIDTWLTWKLCGAHVTDPSNASRTLLFNIHTMDWDDELLEMLSIPRNCLPNIVDNSQVIGLTKDVGFLSDGIPVAGLAGDQQSALFGQACFQAGSAKCTYGTGAFVLMNTGNKPIPSKNALLTTVGWRINGVTTYALEGSAFIAGAAVQWLRDGLNIISTASEVEALAQEVDNNGGTYFVPAFAGLGAPHWEPTARGVFWGITGGTTKAHLARAVLEGVAMQIVDILDSMASDAEQPLTELRVDGGMSKNNFMMQLQSNLLDVACTRPTVLETTALGAGFLAGLAVGVWKSPQAISDAWQIDQQFSPKLNPSDIENYKRIWASAVQKSLP